MFISETISTAGARPSFSFEIDIDNAHADLITGISTMSQMIATLPPGPVSGALEWLVARNQELLDVHFNRLRSYEVLEYMDPIEDIGGEE